MKINEKPENDRQIEIQKVIQKRSKKNQGNPRVVKERKEKK